MKHLLFAIFLSLVMSGCATPYKKKGWNGGYWETSIGRGKYLVGFEGNGYTGRDVVTQYAAKRAGEVCRENNYMDFDIGQIAQETTTDRSPSSFNCTNNGYNTTCSEVAGIQINKPSVQIIVTCK